MTVTINLPQDLRVELAQEAESLRLPLAEYLLHVISARRIPEPSSRTGAEVVAYWQAEGLSGARRDIDDSQKRARELRSAAENRDRPV